MNGPTHCVWDWVLGKYRYYRSPSPEGLFDPEVPHLPHSPQQLGFSVEHSLVSLPMGCQFLGTGERALGRLACDSTSRRQASARLPEGIGALGGLNGLGGFGRVGGLGCPDWMEREHSDALQQIASMQTALAAHDKALRAHMAKECRYLKSKGIDCQHCKGDGLGLIPFVPFLGLGDVAGGGGWLARLRPLVPIALAFVAGVLILKGLKPRRARANRRRRNTDTAEREQGRAEARHVAGIDDWVFQIREIARSPEYARDPVRFYGVAHRFARRQATKVWPRNVAEADGLVNYLMGKFFTAAPAHAQNRRRANVKLRPGQRWRRHSGEMWKACTQCAKPMGPFQHNLDGPDECARCQESAPTGTYTAATRKQVR